MKKPLITFLVMFSAIVFAQDIVQMVKIGQEKNEIKKILGTPIDIKQTAKSSEQIWGPEEEFWSEIPMKAKLEVWRYKSENGQLNLYFVNGSNKLSFKAFAPVGVVYESN
jgi:hypothetical protein